MIAKSFGQGSTSDPASAGAMPRQSIGKACRTTHCMDPLRYILEAGEMKMLPYGRHHSVPGSDASTSSRYVNIHMSNCAEDFQFIAVVAAAAAVVVVAVVVVGAGKRVGGR